MLDVCFSLAGTSYRLLPPAIDISIPLYFDGEQPNTYGVPKAQARAFEGGGFIGDVRLGGSCNFESYTLIPHCNGTHTECIGHITAARISVHEVLQDSLIPATLISLTAVSKTPDSYLPPLDPEDAVLDRQGLEQALRKADPAFLEALVIRTLPNAQEKKSRNYQHQQPPFFTMEAMRLIRQRGVRHLLIDLPSVDRLFDEGLLSAHHIFWGLAQGAGDTPADPRAMATLTEMIYVPDEVPDGKYLLNLQIAPFHADAAPSRPRLFRLENDHSMYASEAMDLS